MEFFREILAFLISQLDTFAIILLAIAIVILSFGLKKREREIEDLQREIELMKNQQ